MRASIAIFGLARVRECRAASQPPLKPIAYSHARWLVPLIVVAVACSSALRAGFVSDDYEMLSSAMHAPDWAAFTLRSDWDRAWFRPWTVWSFWLELHSTGAAAWTFHAFNLVVHCANAILLGVLVEEITLDRRAALVSSALFAAMPVHAEAVTWVSGRFDLMAALGVLVALVAWLRSARSEAPALRDGVLVIGGAVLAFGSKETSLLLLVLMPACMIVARRPLAPRAWIFWAVIGVTIAWFFVRAHAITSAGGSASRADAENQAILDISRIPRYVTQAALHCFVPVGGRSSDEIVGIGGFPGVGSVAPMLYVAAMIALLALAVRTPTERETRRRILRCSAGFSILFLLAVLPYAAMSARLYPDLRNARFVYLASAFACALSAQPIGVALSSASRARRALSVSLVIAAIGAAIVATRAVDARWVEAGARARNIVASFPLCEARDGPVHVHGLPDAFMGAYVFRNAFHLALEVERGCAITVSSAPVDGARSFRWNSARGVWVVDSIDR